MSRVRLLRLFLCLVLAVCAVVLGAASVQRKVATFQPVGFTSLPLHEQPGLSEVGRVEDPGTGLRPHDRVLLVDGAEVTGGGTRLDTLLKRQAESSLTILRGDRVVTVKYRRPSFSPDLAYVVLALIGCLYILIGIYTLLRQGGRQSLVFCLWCLVSATLYLVTPVPPADATYRILYIADQLCRILMPGMTLHLFLVFPSRLGAAGDRGRTATLPTDRRKVVNLLPFVYLPGAVLLTLHLDLMLLRGRWLFGHLTADKLIALDRLDLLHLVAVSLAALGVLIYRLASHTLPLPPLPEAAQALDHPQGAAAEPRRLEQGALSEPRCIEQALAEDWEQRRQLHWLTLGLAGGYLPFLLFYVTPFVLGWHEGALASALAVMPLALVPLTFGYAILRYRLWDIEVIARETVSFALTLLIGVVGFSLINTAISRGISADFGVARNLLSFAAGLSIAGLLMPARHSLSSALERLQYRTTFRKRRALSGLGRDLLHERDLGKLCGSLLERLRGAMAFERVNLFLVQGDRLAAVSPETALSGRASLEEIEPEFWKEGFRRLFGVELPATRTSVWQRMFLAGYRYAFPLTVRGRGIGIACASFKHNQMPLNSEDIALVRQLLIQAALAVENAQLLHQLQDQLEEMRRLKLYSDGIFESSPAGIAVLDEEFRLVSVNHALARLVGQPSGELVHRKLAALLPVGELPRPFAAPLEVVFKDAAGHDHNLQISVADFAGHLGEQGEQGEPREAGGELRVLVVHDITERVLMENALKEKDRLASLGMLAAGVAHEVNTPITGISSYAQMLLADTAESDPHYPILKKVERQTFRAASIVNNLLELARDRKKERRPVAIEPLLAECLELLGDRLERQAVEVRWELPHRSRQEARPLLVMGCDSELQQVFTNLFSNALDAMAGMEHKRLGVSLTAGEANVAVRVRDTGPGIPPEAIDTVFKPFFSTKLHRGGTGLGLSISHEIVQRHGGRLSVESAPGEGACFLVELPRPRESHEHPHR